MRGLPAWTAGVLAATLVGAGSGMAQAPTPTPAVPFTSFAVFALSRGKGVPPAAREVMLKVTELVDADKRRGVRVEARRTRIGLEGETKLCVEYQNAAEARVAHERIDKLVKDVDLVNLVPGPCSGPEKPHDGKEKP
jgi:hypothetical protein